MKEKNDIEYLNSHILIQSNTRNCRYCFCSTTELRTINKMSPDLAGYTLFELFKILEEKGIQIHTQIMNWRSMVSIIRSRDIQLPSKPIDIENTEPDWMIERGRYDQYAIRMNDIEFMIMENDIIIGPDDVKYLITDIYFQDPSVWWSDDDKKIKNSCQVTMMDMNSSNIFIVKAQDIVFMVDCEDIDYEKSTYLDTKNSKKVI